MSKNQFYQNIKCKNCQNRKDLSNYQRDYNNNEVLNEDNNGLFGMSNSLEQLNVKINSIHLNDYGNNLAIDNDERYLRTRQNSDYNENTGCLATDEDDEDDFAYLKNDDLCLLWKNKRSCIVDRLGCMYLNDKLADVYFIVGDDSNCRERIPAHKFILSIGSPVFHAMFYGSGQQMDTSTEIDLPDIEITAFKCLLKFLYTDELHIEADSVMNILYAAKKYAVCQLEKECVDYLKRNVKPDNAFMLLTQAKLFDELHLEQLCLEIIDKYSNEAFSSECFLDIDLNLLIDILKRDSLGIKEAKLFNCVIKWAHTQCQKNNIELKRENIQKILGNAIKYIRYPLMTKEEFANAMSINESRILNDGQIVDLFIYFILNNSNSNNFQFINIPRCFIGNKEQIINRFGQVESRWGYSGTSDRIRFNVNKRILIAGFGLYGSIYGKCEYQVLIQLIHFESCKICAQNNTSFTCDGSNSTFRVLFKEPIEIDADTDYVAAATLKGPDSYYGTKGMKTLTHELQSGNKIIFQFNYASGNNNGSSVEDGQLPEILFFSV